MAKLKIAQLQNTTTDTAIVANRLIKGMKNVLHGALNVQCAKMGHWATCCRQDKPRNKNKNISAKMSQIRVLSILGKKKYRRAPRKKAHIHHNADESVITTAQATPGAEATVAGLDILKNRIRHLKHMSPS